MAPKGIFIDFDFEIRRPGQKYRPKTSLKELNQIWAGLRTNARTALTTKIKAAEATAARAAEQTLIANAARTAFTRPGQSLYDFQSRYRKAKDEAEYLDTLETRNLAAWKALRKEYKKHGTLPQATKDAVKGAKDTVRDRLIVVGGMRDFLDDWNDTAMPAPRDDNDEPKILESFLSARRKDAVRNKVAREAAKEGEDDVLPSDEEHRWQAWKSIGEGGNGQAWVWVCFDQDDKIIERTVRKDTDYSAQWHDIRWWTGEDIRDYRNRAPLEHTCHERMTATAQPGHTVRMTSSWRPSLVDPVTQTHRIYTEWCFLGDLISLIERYRQYETEADRVIPEPMIWATAEALAYAGLAMAKGSEDPTAPPDEDWKPVVHRDLKPDNIFLTSQDKAPNAAWSTTNYPKCLLGDFGIAFQTFPNDHRNPDSYHTEGTPSFLAPEQHNYINFQTLESMNPHKLGEKTNVWGMGAILWSLVTLKNGPDNPPDWIGRNPEGDMTYRLEDDEAYATGMGNGDNSDDDEEEKSNAWRYTPALRRLIDSCLSHNPDDRPDFASMLATIQAEGDDPGDEPPDDEIGEEEYEGTFATKGMRSGWARDATKGKYALKNKDGTLWGPVDPYREGLEVETERDGELREAEEADGDEGEEDEDEGEEEEQQDETDMEEGNEANGEQDDEEMEDCG
ncbi:hypothetical protein CLAFUW4_04240 [Fulvia fulva]|nr:hypothetical protein CLAFUR4_04226 [Fulvia fulva]WPV13418.1 hypothetical protein CLAFUW4_04240 [Fulvia fulva]WPV29078.1 hypothetical protein CLAFUW7_04229 [Fulvia fulva]